MARLEAEIELGPGGILGCRLFRLFFIAVETSENFFFFNYKTFSRKLENFVDLKWSCNATFKSKLSPRSANPIPMKAERPFSSCSRRTKYRLESNTGWIAVPGYESIGALANNSPLLLSSSFSSRFEPFVTARSRPTQSGLSRPQSAALKKNTITYNSS